HRNIICDVIPADRETTALFHRAVDVQNVIGRAATDVDDERAEIFLMLSQYDLRGSERAEDHIFYFERELLDPADRDLNPRPHAVDDVEVGFEFFAEHADRIQNAF